MKYSINLFPEPERDSVDKIVYFAIHYLRYILVMTMFVVICVFFFRFKVDQEIVNLRESLTQKKQIIETTENMLEEVAYLEAKTDDLGLILDQQDQYIARYRYFISTIPEEMAIDRIAFEERGISFTGFSVNPAVIQDYEQKINQDGFFSEVNLGNLQRTDDGFSFSVQLGEYNTGTPVTDTETEATNES